MAVFKCKMCGGNLEVTAGMRICQCGYCRTFQTVPDISDERRLGLFSRANQLRFDCEFDRAMGIYEIITAEFHDDPEAYWGLCLCRYGIEYVDDLKTGKKIPTCHRTCFESILDDKNFRLALQYSDYNLQQVYSKEAELIDSVQKNILAVARREKPFDVFICYKETDENGERTPDSFAAEKIYNELSYEGLKVFFARETLKSKPGCEYEPYIFSAINSASVMIAVGSKKEYFQAVWVKNEWSRFLDFMKRDRNKILIPCCVGTSVSEMPEEFLGFQAYNFEESGSLHELADYIKKIKIDNPNNSVPYDTVINQYEEQLKSERQKLRGLEEEKHLRAVEEKKNAYKLYGKERLPVGLLLILDVLTSFIIAFIVLGIFLANDLAGDYLFLIWIGSMLLPIVIAYPYVSKRNKKASIELQKRLSYDEVKREFDNHSY